jgi:hypothetical protein
VAAGRTVDTCSGASVEATCGGGSPRFGCLAQLDATAASSAAVTRGAERIQAMSPKYSPPHALTRVADVYNL